MAAYIKISTSNLPDSKQSQMIFEDSTFFKQKEANGEKVQLPPPAEVRARVKGQVTSTRPPPVTFDSLRLLVKYGPHLTPSEAQCLWAVKKHLKDKVPVPEVYGWRRDGKELFIYMELIQGPTLEQRWESLSHTERAGLCTQLHAMINQLRLFQQDPEHQFIGSFGGQCSTDVIFDYYHGGPFPSIKSFHDWYSKLYLRKIPKHANSVPDPYRKDLPDNVPIRFTHNDLHPSNIIVSDTGPLKIRAIVDWHQSGWYPEYWEYCKTHFSSDFGSDWATTYIPSFVRRCDTKVYEAWHFYLMAQGGC